MKILYFSFVELDVPNACKAHTLGVIKGFSHHFCKVDALLPKPKYVHPDIPNVRLKYLWPWRFSTAGRIWLKFLLLIRMVLLCTLNRYEAIYVRELENNPAPRWCSWLYGIPLYIEINDLIPECLKMKGAKNSILRQVVRNQEKDFEQASGIIVNSIPMKNWIRDKYYSAYSKIHLIINGTDSINSPKVSRKEILRKLGLPERGFYIGYLGSIYGRFDFFTPLKCIQSLMETISEIHFIIIGDGPELGNLKKLVATLQLQNRVIFTGYINDQNLYDYLPAFDIALIPLARYATELYGSLPTKFATYSSFNLPIISTLSDLKGYPKEIGDGIALVPPENARALADMILWLYHHPEERKEKAKILHDFAIKKLTWEAATKDILDIINHDKELK